MTESSAPEGEMPPLEPCPFCGSAPKLLALTESDGFEREYLVHCDECAISLGGEYQSDAIAAWNRRADAATSAAQAELSKVVVTKNEAGQIVAVTRQDMEGRVISVIAESAAPDHPSPSREGPSDAEMRAGSICQPDGLMFDAFGNPRTRAVRGDVYLSDQEIDRLPDFEGW